MDVARQETKNRTNTSDGGTEGNAGVERSAPTASREAETGREQTSGNRQRFADLVRIEAMDGGFLRVEDERRLLQEGVARHGLSLEEARGVVLSTANENGLALQRAADSEVSELIRLQASRARGNKLSRSDFEQAVRMYRAKTRSRVSDEEARRRVKSLMDEAGVKPKPSGWLIRSRRWYNAIKPG